MLFGTRRLLDKGQLHGAKGVYSIRSVIGDVQKNWRWLTRRVYVEKVYGAEYNLDRLYQELSDRTKVAEDGPMWINPELSKSRNAHEAFDKLSGTLPSERYPSDLIRPEVFEKTEERLAKLDRICIYVNSHLAHAGNKESRASKTLENFDIRNAEEILKQLKEVADFVGVYFANESSAGLATYLGDLFEGLDHAIVDTSDLPGLDEQWQSLEKEIGGWSISPEDL